MIINQIGPQAGSSSIVGGDTLPASPTFRQVFVTPSGMYVSLTSGSWSLLDSADAGTVSGSGVTNRLTKWTDGAGSVLGDAGVADDGTYILSLRPIATGYGLSAPAQLLAGPRISAASTISTAPRGILSAQYSADTAAARVNLQKARGTVGTPVIITTGDLLGQVIFRGFDGTGYLEMGSITSTSTGTIATNRVPTTMTFATATNAGPSVLTTALTLGADQSATFAAAVTIPSVDINAGTIDATVIGGTGPAAGSFTTVAASGNISSSAGNHLAPNSGGFLSTGGESGMVVRTAGNLDFYNGSAIKMIIATTGAITLTSGITDATGTPGSLCYNTSSFLMLKNNALTCTVSAAEFKRDIAPITEGLDVLLRMNPSQFAYKDNPDRARWGFVADELQAVNSKLADGYDAKGHAKSIDHAAIMAVNIKAVQELNDKVEILEKRLMVLSEQVH